MPSLRLNRLMTSSSSSTTQKRSASASASASSSSSVSSPMSQGAKAGLGIGIAVAAILALLILAFLLVHFRRRAAHLRASRRMRDLQADEKNQHQQHYHPDWTAAATAATGQVEEGVPPPGAGAGTGGGGMRRTKSVKDRLMGPLYRDSTIDLMPLAPPSSTYGGSGNNNRTRATGLANATNRQSSSSTTTMSMTLDLGPDGQPVRPWAASSANNSPRASFSSKRATRMMMMM